MRIDAPTNVRPNRSIVRQIHGFKTGPRIHYPDKCPATLEPDRSPSTNPTTRAPRLAPALPLTGSQDLVAAFDGVGLEAATSPECPAQGGGAATRKLAVR